MTGTPRQNDGNAHGITRRGLMLAGIQLGVVTTLALTLRSLQVEHAEQYRMLADGNSIKIRLLVPARGLIHDRNGIVIAGNEQNYRVTLTREEAGGGEPQVYVRTLQHAQRCATRHCGVGLQAQVQRGSSRRRLRRGVSSSVGVPGGEAQSSGGEGVVGVNVALGRRDHDPNR